ncbi:hypothetical protein VDG1235_2158 [Verrucomicrobiia bacterium DG1235]|nr:hypothetical protein VDG1235_2158 [Verrucomicrobiae bacterium DG1235]
MQLSWGARASGWVWMRFGEAGMFCGALLSWQDGICLGDRGL